MEAAVQLASQGIHNPGDLARLAQAMNGTDPEKVFRRMCEIKGMDPTSVMEQAKALASMSGIFGGMRRP